MNVNEAVKIVEAIPDHQYITTFFKIGDPLAERIVQLDGSFSANELQAIAIVMERKPEHWE